MSRSCDPCRALSNEEVLAQSFHMSPYLENVLKSLRVIDEEIARLRYQPVSHESESQSAGAGMCANLEYASDSEDSIIYQ